MQPNTARPATRTDNKTPRDCHRQLQDDNSPDALPAPCYAWREQQSRNAVADACRWNHAQTLSEGLICPCLQPSPAQGHNKSVSSQRYHDTLTNSQQSSWRAKPFAACTLFPALITAPPNSPLQPTLSTAPLHMHSRKATTHNETTKYTNPTLGGHRAHPVPSLTKNSAN